MQDLKLRIMTVAAALSLNACGGAGPEIPLEGDPSPYLFIFAGDQDAVDSDFLAVIDVDPASKTRGAPISSTPIGYKDTMPHHTEYVVPPDGEPIFMNAHKPEMSLIVDVNDPTAPTVTKTFQPPHPLRFPHDYTRTPSGTRLVGFLRSEGDSPYSEETVSPGNHGGIAEYSIDGELLRTTSAAAPGLEKPVRPYAFALLPDRDRLVVTSAPMMEKTWADVIQIYRYSDFELLHTLPLPVGRLPSGKTLEGSEAAGFGPRLLENGDVFLNSYGCAFYHLSAIETDTPVLEMVHALDTPVRARPDQIRGACGIPVRVGKYWLQPVGHLRTVVVLDVSDPSSPREVHRLKTPDDFRPHWLAKDPQSNRLILGAELGGEQGFYMLKVDQESGRLGFDEAFRGKRKGRFGKSSSAGYIGLERESWPHGETGNAWGHAALFLDG
ncbi:MAG: hypothetical protein AAFR21_10090 [Pseudomonadota bacterium]